MIDCRRPFEVSSVRKEASRAAKRKKPLGKTKGKKTNTKGKERTPLVAVQQNVEPALPPPVPEPQPHLYIRVPPLPVVPDPVDALGTYSSYCHSSRLTKLTDSKADALEPVRISPTKKKTHTARPRPSIAVLGKVPALKDVKAGDQPLAIDPRLRDPAEEPKVLEVSMKLDSVAQASDLIWLGTTRAIRR